MGINKVKVNNLTILSERFFKRFSNDFLPYFSQVGLGDNILLDETVEISEVKYIALWELAANATNPDLGLEIGQRVIPSDIGVLGHALESATTIYRLLDILAEYFVIYAQNSAFNYKINTNDFNISYQVTDPSVVYKRQDSEFAISASLGILQYLLKTEIKPIKVCFEHNKPKNISSHKKIFNCPIVFSHDENCIVLDKNLLQLPLPRSDIRLYNALQPYLESQRDLRKTEDFLTQIKVIISAELKLGVPTLQVVSQKMHLTVRSLQRKLKTMDIDYTTLLDSIRKERALHFITSESNYAIAHIAELVGYSETSSFNRAFKRWVGETPMNFRLKNAHFKQNT